jgi:hypothetical protein
MILDRLTLGLQAGLQYGEPVALCEACRKIQPIPEACQLQWFAEKSLLPCVRCGRSSATLEPVNA